jgi:hypothetical protein
MKTKGMQGTTKIESVTSANKYTLIAKKRKNELYFYLVEASGRRHYLMFHRFNGLLFQTFRSGMTLGAIHRMKANRSLSGQTVLHASRHIARVAANFIKFELSGSQNAA